MYIVTREEIQALDRYTIEKIGLPGVVLMENAGAQVVAEINRIASEQKLEKQARRALVLCGGGNNGGDGFVIGRRLLEQGWGVQLCLLVAPEKITGDAQVHYQAYRNRGYPLMQVSEENIDQVATLIKAYPLVVDALLGTGFTGGIIREPMAQVIKWVNQQQQVIGQERSRTIVVAVDIPSGVCSNTGQVEGLAIQATHTFTFVCPKRGFFLPPGQQYIGEWKAVDISVPSEGIEQLGFSCPQLSSATLVRQALPNRTKAGYKGTFGHVLVIGGSQQFVGAPLFSAKAALHSGAGLVTMAVPEVIYAQVSSQLPTAMFMPLPDESGFFSLKSAQLLREKLGNFDCLALGPGLGRWEQAGEWLRLLFAEPITQPIIIDADGLYHLAQQPELRQNMRGPVICTPHAGEMARLLQSTAAQVERERLEHAQRFAQKQEVYLILKGYRSIIATPQGQLYINPTGHDALAKGGTGDVLTGILAGFMTQGSTPLQAMLAATYIHGLAGEQLAERHSRYSVTPDRLLEQLGQTLDSIVSSVER